MRFSITCLFLCLYILNLFTIFVKWYKKYRTGIIYEKDSINHGDYRAGRVVSGGVFNREVI